MPRLKPFLPQNFDLLRLARTIRLEKISGVSLSHFENSQNLNVSSRSMILAYLRNYATSVPSPTLRALRGEEHARFDRFSASLLIVFCAGIRSIPPPE